MLALALLLALPAQAAREVARSVPLPLDAAALAARPQVELKVVEKGQPVTYRGVPLRVLLEGELKDERPMRDLRRLSDAVLLVSATDNYRVAVSAAAVGLDEKGERYLLALERDGKALGDGQGPLKLIIATDPEPVRWVRMVSGVALVEFKGR